ncbi:hypothetical protein AXG93_763s1110 [Marchantia polymorpha subsp. ruderalis]|uniref:At2g23090-like zinc-binding domain-containing protein n=1 Tax=Marchantia polymorpha subsp. ruderalis TaxID=1480154 RepID=A0A176WPN5_MARPO|nr:hypothetical protein AXG93_763s1110 [Marchantia polymorpha subsp. ruderalis]
MARERNAEKLKGAKGSQLETNKKAMTIQCKICMQTFICTTSEAKCKEHAEARHPKNELAQCFPHLAGKFARKDAVPDARYSDVTILCHNFFWLTDKKLCVFATEDFITRRLIVDRSMVEWEPESEGFTAFFRFQWT